jgi:hypothetical protein
MLVRTPPHLREPIRTNHTSRGTLTERFKNAWKLGVEGIISAGRVLIQANDELPHGEWLDWLENDLHLHPRKAQMLMLIARHPVLSNAYHWYAFPPSWRTLYELTQLCRPKQNPQRMLDLITSGKINPFMTREDAQALVTGKKQEDGKLILSAELARVMRQLDQLTTAQAITNLQADPGSNTPATLNKFGRRLLNIAKQWRELD